MRNFIILLIASFLLFFQNFPLFASEKLKELFEQATGAFSQGDYGQAIKLYEQTLEIHPDFAPSYNFLGLSHKAVGTDLTDVAWLFKTAIDIDPNYAQAYDNLGKTYYSLGDFNKAEEHCLKAIELDPGLVTAKLALGWIYLLGKSQPGDAIHYFSEVVESREQLPFAYFGLGLAYFMEQQHFRVLEMITTLRKIEREDLASQLEELVRSNRFGPDLIPGQPLIMPNKQPGILVMDIDESSLFSSSFDPKDGGERRVRLRRGVDQEDPQALNEEQKPLTYAERIQVLQKKRSGLRY
ncbi:MAG: TPR Domain containing protein [candidate division CPR1 bacterium GW2011_GWA2_42_17]|uniref:TPR Domain containing protein n=1 Tax=candidate division CPR1 bacterium GW2011_GWA2_42_17 TaxID=1618341 RepID=A0A0G0Z7N9_9BACT|nr:MAG: TPR Domain containing protein [candidate division CPR1 bacterium GW2011_GWA2_42_17]